MKIPITIVFTCGVVQGHEHPTQEDARRCIDQFGEAARQFVEQVLQEWRCANCRHWQQGRGVKTGYREMPCSCQHPNVIYSDDIRLTHADTIKSLDGDPLAPDGLAYGDHEGYAAGLVTGPEFGCILFEAKTSNE